jgi:hypothetical protein
MIELLEMLGKMGMPAGFDISSIVGGKAAPGAPPTASPAPTTMGGPSQQTGGGIPQPPAMTAAPDPRRPVDMSALMQAINNRPKLGI